MTDDTTPAAIDLARGDLLDAKGRTVVLRRRSLGVLLSLARSADRVVPKEELIAANWPGTSASDETLAQCISDIRAALGLGLRETVRTASGRGYMLQRWKAAADGRLLAPQEPEGHEHRGEGAERPSIAVLPFASAGDGEPVSYLGDGIAEDLIDALSRVRWFFVIAKGSSFTYRDRTGELRDAARGLGVRYVLDGSVRRDGRRIRLSGRLVEAETGRQLWAGRADGTLDDIFELQDRITAGVVAAVEPNVRHAEIERARRKPTADLGAYDLYLRALPLLFAYTRATFVEGEALLRAAIKRDSAYSDALAALADCVGRMALNGWTSDRDAAFAESCALAGRAVAADPENPTTLATAAWASAMFAGGFDQALDLAGRALELHPNSHAIRSYCGWVYAYAGESNRAIEQFNEARRLSPVDARGYFPLLGIATSHYFARRFDVTLQTTRRILSEVPEHNIARRYMAAALAHMGNAPEAADAMRDLLARQPDYSLAAARGSRFRHIWMLDLWLDGLRKAGLPENPR